MRKLVIAGVTGSIGQQALDVISAIPDLDVIAVGAGSDLEGALKAASSCQAGVCCVEAQSGEISSDVDLRTGNGSIAAAIRELRPDIVLNAVVGFAGVGVTRAAIEVGADLALANKESLVAGGSVVTDAAATAGTQILPVDSEHAALAQLLDGESSSEVEAITLTASGGPFRGLSSAELGDVTVTEALNHPTWDMGGKISIDSATLMNKGLEVIEAERLFGLDFDQINVVVHPQSIVHALVSFRDGVQTGHLGLPDMRSPIAWALASRVRPPLNLARLNLAEVGSLTFESVDSEAFPSLDLAYTAGRLGGGAPAVLNAANEVAVEAFLAGQLRFDRISDVVRESVDRFAPTQFRDWDDVIAADKFGRTTAAERIARIRDEVAS